MDKMIHSDKTQSANTLINSNNTMWAGVCWSQNFLQIENWTIIHVISWDMQDSHILQKSFENNPQKYIFHFFSTDQPTWNYSNEKKYLIQ